MRLSGNPIGMKRLKALVRQVDGSLVVEDPDALGMISAVGKYNCRATLDQNAEAVGRFKLRMVELGQVPAECVIVVINADDEPAGRLLASVLMPAADWAPIRARGEVLFARGLAKREGIADFLRDWDPAAHGKLAAIDGPAVVVVDHGAAEVYPA